MNKLLKTLASLLFCLLLNSCGHQSPQLPSNKGVDVDNNAVSLLAINQNLAKKEDVYLEKVVHKQGKTFKKNELGFWYQIDPVGNGSRLKDSVICKFSCRIMTLQGKILQQGDKQIVIGKKQDVVGLEEGLKLMNKGDSATFIIPWYLAYGMKGKGRLVPAYTSIIYHVKVYN